MIRALVLLMALAASPAAAQGVRWYAGPTFGWVGLLEYARIGLNAGVSIQGFDEHPNLRIDLRFVQRGGDDCCSRIHSLQVPVLYTTMRGETGYVFVGPAVGYSYFDEHVVDLSAVVGVGSELVRTETRVIGWEASYSISLPAYFVSYYGIETAPPLQGLSLNVTLR